MFMFMLKQHRAYALIQPAASPGFQPDRQSRQDDYRLYRPSPTEALDRHTDLAPLFVKRRLSLVF